MTIGRSYELSQYQMSSFHLQEHTTEHKTCDKHSQPIKDKIIMLCKIWSIINIKKLIVNQLLLPFYTPEESKTLRVGISSPHNVVV